MFDYEANETLFKDRVKDYFEARGDGSSNLPFPDLYGYAAISAYRTYNESLFLNLAENAWNRANAQVITDGNLGTWQSICGPNFDSSRLIGGVYFVRHHRLCKIQWSLTWLMIEYALEYVFYREYKRPFSSVYRLSALLAEETPNTTYLDVAGRSSAFMRNNMFGTQGVVQSIDIRGSCTNPQLYDPIVEHTGLWIEGLSVLTSITGNFSMVDLIRNAVQVSTTRTNGWQNDEGIMISKAKATMTSQGNFVRSLGIAYQRLTSAVDLRQYMRSYISVQYNAILEQATTANSNIYGYWTGPSYSVFQSDNQTSAMNVLITAISLPEVDSRDSGSKLSVGGIIGGVVGGVVVVVLGIVALIALRRRRKIESPKPPDLNIQLDPFPQDTEPTLSTSSGPTASTFSQVKGRFPHHRRWHKRA
ncbi:hypothetical protein VNI00_007251 [Paramarasmius palmivorus]|uniref:Glycoside hydrolase family 76 protein n=1 Tax=Paramarasmius palmivorus TaxID=297713 RepID=A0AAW0D3Y8_9AGAR